MPVRVPDYWPEWDVSELEHLGKCPVCQSAERELLHSDLIDRWFHAAGRWSMHRCQSCASAYIDPRPDSRSIHKAYANYETHRPAGSGENKRKVSLALRLRNGYLNSKYGYRQQPSSDWGYLAMHLLPPPLRYEWDHYARHLPFPAPGSDCLLDVGCGNGEFLVRARSQGWKVHGLDVDEGALSHARAAGVPVTNAVMRPELFAEASFDSITTHQVIEHVHDPAGFLRCLYRWLKPGGRLWLGTPNSTSALHAEFGSDWCDLHPPQHLILFSPEALLSLLAEIGFKGACLLPRGYLDSHFYAQSRLMEGAPEVGDWQSLNQANGNSVSIIKRIALEGRAWLRPQLASDLVVVAWKPD